METSLTVLAAFVLRCSFPGRFETSSAIQTCAPSSHGWTGRAAANPAEGAKPAKARIKPWNAMF